LKKGWREDGRERMRKDDHTQLLLMDAPWIEKSQVRLPAVLLSYNDSDGQVVNTCVSDIKR